MLNGTDHHAARELAEKLAAARHHNYWMARCPAHADDKASLAIKEAGEGRVLVYCHAGCSQDAVIDALRDRGMWPDRPKTNGETKPRVTIVAIYDYVDTDDTAAIVSNVMTAADVPKWQLNVVPSLGCVTASR